VIRSQPVLNSQIITQILTWESCDFLSSVLICFNCLESDAPAYRVQVYISQLIRCFPRTYCSEQDVLDWRLLLTRKLLKQGFLLVNLKSSLRKFYNRHHDLVNRYEISVSHTTTYVPIVVDTSRSSPHPRLAIGCVTRVTRRVPLVEPILLTPQHMCSPLVFSGVRVARSLFVCVLFCRAMFVLFRLVIMLSVRRLISLVSLNSSMYTDEEFTKLVLDNLSDIFIFHYI
jgi:hypothetical protein